MSKLKLSSINSGYNGIEIIHDLSIDIPDNGFVTLVGKNGVGKTTILNTIVGLSDIFGGNIFYDGENITKENTENISKKGIAIVPERRRLFSGMTVEDNLSLGHYPHETNKSELELVKEVFDKFPKLEERRTQIVDSMSGGEQQMVAFGRALMAQPDLLLIDEPTEGLMPTYVDTILETLEQLHEDGKSILLVEQNVEVALEISDYCYVINNGSVEFQAESQQLASNKELRNKYITI